jgi:hypothetical protein
MAKQTSTNFSIKGFHSLYVVVDGAAMNSHHSSFLTALLASIEPPSTSPLAKPR